MISDIMWCAGTGTCSADKSADDTAALDRLASLRELWLSIPCTQEVTTDPASISSGSALVPRHLCDFGSHVVRRYGDVFG